MTKPEIEKKIAEFKEVLAETTDASEKAAIQKSIDKLEEKLSQIPEEKKTEPKVKKEIKVKVKKEKKAKKAKKPTAKTVHADSGKSAKDVSCKELKESWRKRREQAKKNAGKKSKPVFIKITDNVEKAIKTAIIYNKGKGDINVPELKKAINSFADALDDIKDALVGKFADTQITQFKKDMFALLKEVETKKMGKGGGIEDEDYEDARNLIEGEFDNENIDKGFTKDEVEKLAKILHTLKEKGIEGTDLYENNKVQDYLTNLSASYKK